MKRWTVALALALVLGPVTTAPAASTYWTEKRAATYMVSYSNVQWARCNGHGKVIRKRGIRRYRRFGCALIYTDETTGTAGLSLLLNGKPFVKFFS